jgi:hypothetical protein
VRAALDAAFASHESFAVGDEVERLHGCMTGVILALDGEDAEISWPYRGKSVEHLRNLAHVKDPRLHQAQLAGRAPRTQVRPSAR